MRNDNMDEKSALRIHYMTNTVLLQCLYKSPISYHCLIADSNGALLGVHISEMDLLNIGTINDMYSEMQRDEEPHAQLASQDDMDRFLKCIAFVSTIVYNSIKKP